MNLAIHTSAVALVARPAYVPGDARALIAVDLGAESCRVSLLRWLHGEPHFELVHRFPNGPVREADGSLRWPLDAIVSGVEQGMRLCAERAPEGIRSVAVDGWAVDYVRIDAERKPLAAPYCYRDERTVEAAIKLHERLPHADFSAITGLQLQDLNTVYQLYADKLADQPAGQCWMNLPEYLLARWGGTAVAEYTNATHTQMVQLEGKSWSREILEAAGLDPRRMPQLVPPGTEIGLLEGPLAQLPAFAHTELIAPACHDTASAVAGIPALGDDWGYISSGTWSLVGTLVRRACNGPQARDEQFTNLGAVGDQLLFQKNLNGMWIIKQCMDHWAATDVAWEIGDLVAAAEQAQTPAGLLDIDDAELLKMSCMPGRINQQRRKMGLIELNESSAGAPRDGITHLPQPGFSLCFSPRADRESYRQRAAQDIYGRRRKSKCVSATVDIGGGGNACLRWLA